MKVLIKRSWNLPHNGITVKEGSEIEIDPRYYNEAYMEKVEVKPKKKKSK